MRQPRAEVRQAQAIISAASTTPARRMARRFLFVLRTKLGDTLIHFQTVPRVRRAASGRRGHAAHARATTRRCSTASPACGSWASPIGRDDREARVAARSRGRRSTRSRCSPATARRCSRSRSSCARGGGSFSTRGFPSEYPEHPPAYARRATSTARGRPRGSSIPSLPRPDRLDLPASRRPGARAATSARSASCRSRTSCAGTWTPRRCDAPGRPRARTPPGPAGLDLLNPSDRSADRVREASARTGRRVAALPQPRELCRIYRAARRWYGTDTGLYHLAVAMGIPATVFFGPTQPQLVVMSEQPEVDRVRLEALGAEHCDEKGCARPRVCTRRWPLVTGRAPPRGSTRPRRLSLARRPARAPPRVPRMRILVIKRDKIGDLLLTTPMLAHLRRSRPRDEIHLLANDYNAWVVHGTPQIDRLWVYRACAPDGREPRGRGRRRCGSSSQLRRGASTSRSSPTAPSRTGRSSVRSQSARGA